MIIGTGLIANAFKQGTFDHTDFVIFASGVSNSREERIEEYERELTLLTNIIEEHRGKKLVYFSSCNVGSDNNSTYLSYKERIENYIKLSIGDYLILRLPNVVGFSTNRYQLLNYFFYALIEQRELTLKVDYIRHLVDVDDLPKIVDLLVSLQVESTVLNVAFDNGVKVKSLIEILERVVGKQFYQIKQDRSENDYVISNKAFLDYVTDQDKFNTKPENIIKKYYSQND